MTPDQFFALTFAQHKALAEALNAKNKTADPSDRS